MTRPVPAAIEAWHAFVVSPTPDGLKALLAPDVEFRSPAVHAAQPGPDLTFGYLWAAVQVIGPTLQYHRQWYGDDSAVLEFTATIDGREVQGVDMISWNADGLITNFTVMARPLRGLEALIAAMGAELQKLAGA